MVYNVTEKETQPKVWNNINGTQSEMLERFAISEICKGWPVYRDSSEWTHFRNLFTDNAYIFTTWSGGVTVDQFIEVSKKGRANGDFIMHRECGTLVDLNQATGRAVGKMKTTITQRFNWDGLEFDIDCDNRFIFFCEKQSNGEWKVCYYKVIYEKDRVVSVDGHSVPKFDEKELEKYPYGYRHLGVAQAKLGHKCLTDLPTMNNEGFTKMYAAMDAWLEGKPVDELLGVPKDA